MTDKTTTQREPDADCFRQGDIWESPKGTVYRVTWVGHKEGKDRKQAELRLAALGDGGRKMVRDWDAVLGGWVRHSCGAAAK